MLIFISQAQAIDDVLLIAIHWKCWLQQITQIPFVCVKISSKKIKPILAGNWFCSKKAKKYGGKLVQKKFDFFAGNTSQ